MIFRLSLLQGCAFLSVVPGDAAAAESHDCVLSTIITSPSSRYSLGSIIFPLGCGMILWQLDSEASPTDRPVTTAAFPASRLRLSSLSIYLSSASQAGQVQAQSPLWLHLLGE